GPREPASFMSVPCPIARDFATIPEVSAFSDARRSPSGASHACVVACATLRIRQRRVRLLDPRADAFDLLSRFVRAFAGEARRAEDGHERLVRAPERRLVGVMADAEEIVVGQGLHARVHVADALDLRAGERLVRPLRLLLARYDPVRRALERWSG